MSVENLVDPGSVESFRQDGAVALRGLFGDWVERLRAGLERNIAEPNPNARLYPAKNGTGRFFSDYCSWPGIPEFREFLFGSPVAEAAGALMGARQVRLFHEHVLVKEPGTDIPTPWHHDLPCYSVDAGLTCSIRVALDPVPRDTAVEFVAGSHRWGRWFRPARFDRSALYENDGLEPVPDIDADRAAYRILGWDLEPGGAAAFHFSTLHGAPGNSSTRRRRRAFSARLVGEGCALGQAQGPDLAAMPQRDAGAWCAARRA